MILYPGEVGVCSEQLYAWMPPQQVPGTLYLTNGRIVFEAANAYPQYGLAQELGLASSTPPPMLNLDLRHVTNVTVIPGASGWHVLRIEASGGAYVYQFQTPQAQNWLGSIQGARGQVSPPLPQNTAATPPGTPGAPPVAAAPPAPAPAAAPAAPGNAWCTRCGKQNPPGAAFCASCGAPQA
jgi:hypothetical protein